MSKKISDAASALADIVHDGSLIAVGGFGMSGNPNDLIEALRDTGVRDLTIVSNNMGIDGQGLGILLESKQVKKIVASYVGDNKLFARMYMDGEIEVEFVPQGTLAERLRAGGAGIAGFYTKTGVGTIVAEGKPHEVFDGETYVLERGIVADVSLVHAYQADLEGNLIYRYTSRNFNPLVATAGRVTVVDAEHLIEDSYLDPQSIMTPGIFVQRVVQSLPREKEIEQRTVRPRPAA